MTERLTSTEVVPYTPVFAIGQLTSDERRVDYSAFEVTTQLTSTEVVLYVPIFAIRQLLSKHGVDRSTSTKIRSDMDWETDDARYRLIQYRGIGHLALYQLRINRFDSDGQWQDQYGINPDTPDQMYYSASSGKSHMTPQQWPASNFKLKDHLSSHPG